MLLQLFFSAASGPALGLKLAAPLNCPPALTPSAGAVRGRRAAREGAAAATAALAAAAAAATGAAATGGLVR